MAAHQFWAVPGCAGSDAGMYRAVLSCIWLYWALLALTGLYWAVKVVQVIQVIQVVQVVGVVRTISLDDMPSEIKCFSCYKPSKYRKKLICHACDERTDERTNRRKVENRAVFCWTRNRNIVKLKSAGFHLCTSKKRGKK